MATFRTIARRVSLAALALLSVAVVALVAYTRSESFQRRFEARALAEINGAIKGTVSWERFDGSLWSGLRIRNLQLSYGGHEIFKAQLAEVDYALLPLFWKKVQITRLAATQPVLDLRKLSDGEWNLVQALSSRERSSGEFDWVVAIDGINIADGDLLLRPMANKPELYRLRKLEIGGRVRIAEGLNVDVDRLASWVDTPQAPQLYVSGELGYRQTGETQTLRFNKFWLQTRQAQSRVMLSGSIKSFANFDSDVRLTVSRLAAADIARFVAEWPAGFDLTGQASLRGIGNALEGKFDLTSRGGQISANVRADLLNQPFPFNANLAIRRFDLGTVLKGQQVAGALDADVKLTGSGAQPETLSGTGTARVSSLSVVRRGLGAVLLRTNFRGKAANITGDLTGPLGQGNWQGELRFDRKPEYSARLSLRELDMTKILDLPGAPSGRLSFDAQVSGAGLEPKTANGRAAIDLLPSRWDPVRVEGGKILARLANGRLQVDQLRVQAASATLSAEGDVGVSQPWMGRARYALEIADLGPWLALAGRQGGGGRLQSRGAVEGGLAGLKTRGTVELRDVKLTEGSAGAARIDFALDGKAGVLPQGTINADASDISGAGMDLSRVQMSATLAPATEKTVALRATARDRSGQKHRLVAEIEDRPAELIVRAREVVLMLADRAWSLTAPATISRRNGDFLIDRMEMRSGAARLSASGHVSLQGSEDFELQATGIELAMLSALLPKSANAKGVLTARAQVRGTAAVPEIAASADLTDGAIGGQSYQGARLRADYRGQRVNVDLAIEQDASHEMQLRGTIPFALGAHPAWRAEALPGIDLRARSAGVSLAFLNGLKLPLENIRGQAAFDLAVSGSLSAPQPRGSFRVLDGAFRVKPIGIGVNQVAIVASGDARRLSFSQITAQSGSGRLDGSGVVSLEGWLPRALDFNLKARRWPAIQDQRYRAIADADVRINGTPEAPAISGNAQVIEGEIRPTLELLEHGAVPRRRDPTIVVVQQRGGSPIATQRNDREADSDLWRALALDLTVVIPNKLWVRHPNAEVELSGKLDIDKRAAGEVALGGVLQTVRGWVGFQGRRFDITRGIVRFTGGATIDPDLDIIGEYRSNEYLVNISAGGRASKPTLALSSQPRLEQSDILAILLFGKPISALNGEEQLSLRQNAIDISTGIAAAQLGQAVAEVLDLKHLGLDTSQVSFSGGELRFGRYVGGQTYFSVGQQLAGKHDREVAVEYQITPNIRVDATTATSGNSGVDIVWRKRY